MAADGKVASLPSIELDNNFDRSEFSPIDGRTESKTCFEQSLSWEVAVNQELLEPETVRARSVSPHCKVILPSTSTQTGKTRRVGDKHVSTEQNELRQKNLNRSGTFNHISLDNPYRESGKLSRSGEFELPIIPSQSKRQRALTEPYPLSSFDEGVDIVEGNVFRKNLSLMYRQGKEVRKLEYDNTASRRTLQEAHDMIGELKAKIEKRNKFIRERNKKEGDVAHVVETLKRERDEKLLEYKTIQKRMTEALALKDKNLEDIEAERTQTEGLYQKQLKENTELMRKLEAREKQIKQLKEKTEKAKKWKDNVRN